MDGYADFDLDLQQRYPVFAAQLFASKPDILLLAAASRIFLGRAANDTAGRRTGARSILDTRSTRPLFASLFAVSRGQETARRHGQGG